MSINLILISAHSYECSNNGCLWGDYTKDTDWGYYDRNQDADCLACQSKCNGDSDCTGVECGGGYCSWWKNACTTQVEENSVLPGAIMQCNKQDNSK